MLLDNAMYTESKYEYNLLLSTSTIFTQRCHLVTAVRTMPVPFALVFANCAVGLN